MESWPPTLPQSLHLNATEGPVEGVSEFKPMLGAPLLWQKGDSTARPVSGQLLLETNAQCETFLTFFRETLGMGTRRFLWDSPALRGEWVVQFAAEDPYQLSGVAGQGWKLNLNLVLVRQVS